MTGSTARCLANIMVAREIMGRMAGGAIKNIGNSVVDKALGRGVTAAMASGARSGTVSQGIVHCLDARFHAV